MISANSKRFRRCAKAAIAAAAIFTVLASSAAWAAEQPTAPPAEASARADKVAPRKNKNDIGLRGHGFVRDGDVFTTIDPKLPGEFGRNEL